MTYLKRFLMLAPCLGLWLVAAPAVAQVETDTTDQGQVEMQDPPEMQGDEPLIQDEFEIQEELPEVQDETGVTNPTGEGRVTVEGEPQAGGVPEAEAGTAFRSQLDAATSRNAFDRLATERFSMYEQDFGRMHDRLETLPENDRARAAYDLIRLRRQHDELVDRQRRMRRDEFETMRSDLSRDFVRFDEEFNRARRDALGDRMN